MKKLTEDCCCVCSCSSYRVDDFIFGITQYDATIILPCNSVMDYTTIQKTKAKFNGIKQLNHSEKTKCNR